MSEMYGSGGGRPDDASAPRGGGGGHGRGGRRGGGGGFSGSFDSRGGGGGYDGGYQRGDRGDRGYVGGYQGGDRGLDGGGYRGGDRGRGRGGFRGGDHGRGGGVHQGADHNRGGGGGGRGGRSGGREGDWHCPNPGCGNLNFARRTECNKCGTPSPAGVGDNRGGDGYNRGITGNSGYGGVNHGTGVAGGSYGGGGNYGGSGSGKVDSYGSNRGREEGGYAQVPPPAPTPSYGVAGGNYPPSNAYSGGNNYGAEPVGPTSGYSGGGPNSYPSYGAPPTGYGGDGSSDIRSQTLPSTGFDGGYGGVIPSRDGGAPQHYGGPPIEPPLKGKQCDSSCGDTCDNSRIYISNLPPDVTTDELRELFGGIGQVGRIKQKRGYKDQWPWSIKIYTDDSGNNKGDAVLSYEDPSAAHSAGGFYNNYDMRGYKIGVAMAEKSAPRPPTTYGHGAGRGGYGSGGDRRRDSYRDGGFGPDRNYQGGQRSRPY